MVVVAIREGVSWVGSLFGAVGGVIGGIAGGVTGKLMLQPMVKQSR